MFEQLSKDKNYSEWFEVYTKYAFLNGFMTDDIGYGNPKDLITRKEVIISTGKFASSKNLLGKEKATKHSFSDSGSFNINDTEMSFVNYAISSKLIQGYEDGTLKVDKTLTRAEAATIIYKFMQGGK